MDFVAGIDGGGTKTTILIGDLEGNVVDKKVLGAFNINSIGSDGFKSLIDEVIQILASYGKCLFLTIGAAGVSNIEMRSICEEKFFNAGVPFELVGDHCFRGGSQWRRGACSNCRDRFHMFRKR